MSPARSRGLVPAEGGGWWVLVDKPAGLTSHDVVDRVRRAAGTRKVGHAGTLDPAATGLLVLAVGRATKALGAGLGSGKSYRGRARLGTSSPTWDLDADWTIPVALPPLAPERVERALSRIAETPLQVAPMMSALKREGQPLHRLARRGWRLEREKRPVEIQRLQLLEHDPATNQFHFEVEGGGGLYVRSLVRDVGALLGVPAVLASLRRLRVGPFHLDGALTLEELEAAEFPGEPS